MKKLIAIVVILSFIFISGCGDTKHIDGYTYDTYGLINKGEKYNPDIEYAIIVGNVIWSILLCESIITPVYFVGFSLYEPIGKRGETPVGVVRD